MLNLEILSDGIPALHLEDSVQLAKEIMMDHHVAHLAVVSEKKLLGILSEESLLDAPSDEAPINSLQNYFQSCIRTERRTYARYPACFQ